MVLSLIFGSGTGALAQKLKSSIPNELRYKRNISVDGELSDWDDTLHYQYEKQRLQYEIANDDAHIYVAMRVVDIDAQMQALHQGFSIGINKEGKKKEAASLSFPVPDRESLRSLMAKDNDQRPADMRLGLLKAVRAFYVYGLVDVVDGPISLDNDYGIRAVVAIDSTDALCYEAVIPLSHLGIDPETVENVAFNVKINGTMLRTVGGAAPMGNRYGGYGYPSAYGRQPLRKEAQQEPGLWFILPLAKP